MAEKEVEDILRKYRSKLSEHIDIESVGDVTSEDIKDFSQQYSKFREEWLSKKTTTYEDLCNTADSLLSLKPSVKDEIKLIEAIKAAHLNITPSGAASLSTLTAFLFVLFGLLIGGLQYALYGRDKKSGIVKEFRLNKFADTIFFCPMDNLEKVKEFFEGWKIKHDVFPILIPERILY